MKKGMRRRKKERFLVEKKRRREKIEKGATNAQTHKFTLNNSHCKTLLSNC
jgi:hypothetical protein